MEAVVRNECAAMCSLQPEKLQHGKFLESPICNSCPKDNNNLQRSLSQRDVTSAFGSANANSRLTKEAADRRMTFTINQCSRQLPNGRFASQSGTLQSLP